MTAEFEIRVGSRTVLDSRSPRGRDVGVVFEDDGRTGYFYALDLSRKENVIVDALHIYDVTHVVDKDKSSIVQFVWSTDGRKSALSINGYVHAVFDFDARRGYCRSNFPPPGKSWSQAGHNWEDSALQLIR
jgi:hypothetical protein